MSKEQEHCENCGGFETKPEGECNKCKHKVLTNEASVDDFFFYDTDKRGLLAKRKSSHGLWDSKLTAFQRATLNNYTGDGHSDINSLLRGYDNGRKYNKSDVWNEIEALDMAISSYYLREPIVTYRSINSDAFWQYDGHFEDLIGIEYSDSAFMSTSPTLNSSALNKDLLMTIKLPSGYGIGAYIDEYNGLDEKEFLLARGSRFLITNAYQKKNLYYIEMELIYDR